MNNKLGQLPESKNDEVSVVMIIRLLLGKLHWIIIAGICLGALTFLLLKFLVAPTYKSNVSFFVYNSAKGVVQTETINQNDLQAAESLATTYSKILESNSVLNAVLDDLGNVISRKDLSRMISVSVVNNTQLLEVTVTSTDAEFACKVAQSFANVAPSEMIRITKAGGVEVVDSPEVAIEKSSPRTVFDTAVGIMLGMIIADIYIILRTLSDRTIYLPEDIESVTGITVLGLIPEIESTPKNYKRWNVIPGGEIVYEKKEEIKSVNG